MRVFKGIAGRVVVPSSIDVYRAFGRLHGTEPGPPDPVPLSEDAPLRELLSIHGEDYEKRWVEQAVMSDPALPGTVLRLPALYGVGDYRPFDYLKRMDDGRPAILMDQQKAAWRFSRGNVKNVAAAIVLAAINEQTKHRMYNVADEHPLTQLEWVQLIAQAAGWSGQIITVAREQLPNRLQENVDWRQDWVVDTSRIRHEVGYQDLESPFEGVRAAVTWLRAHPPEQLDRARFNYAAEDEALGRLKL
jgi:nucleoside-diphosphate-sugar epimerase